MRTYVFTLMIPFLIACTTKEELSSVSESFEGGSWKSRCSYSGSSYDIQTVSFSGGQFTQSSTSYNNSGCAGALIKIDITGTYVLGGKLSESSNSQKIDETLATATVTALDASVVSYYNSVVLCGYSDWALGVAKDVAGKSCNSTTMPAVGAMSYDIYYIWEYSIPSQGIDQGMLNFGYNDASHDGKSPAQRPDSLNGNYNYYKQ